MAQPPDAISRFVSRHPYLWHLAHGDAWPGLLRHGLLSSERLVDLFEVPAEAARTLMQRRRDDSVTITHPRHGTAVLRDQKPVRLQALAGALTGGMTPEDWLLLLNQYVFLFPSDVTQSPMYVTYRHEPLVVLTLSTASLVPRHEEKIRLTGINTGYFMRRPAARGRETFQPIASFDRPLSGVKEIVVQGGIPDLMDHLVKAERHWPDGTIEALWEGSTS